MSLRPPGGILVLVVAAVALALVPGAFPASDAGAGGDALEVALEHMSENAADFGVTGADVANLAVTNQYTSAHNKVTHVNLNQRYRGLEVFSGHVTVNVSAAGEVIFASGTLVRDLAVGASGAVGIDVIDAVQAAAEALDLDEPSGLRVIEGGGPASSEAVVSSGGISEAPIPVRLGWQPTEDGLRLAWQLEIDDASDIHYWNATVDAATGELLDFEDWTIEDEHDDLAATVHGGGLPTPAPAPVEARGFSLNPVIDGSCYRVYDLALESPLDGDRRLVCNPADSLASPFGWHDVDGVPGAEFTILRGNNVHAYLDQDANNQPDFGEPDGGPGLQFDYPIDLDEHSQAYREAVVTNLFFGCNTFHDLLYLYGFTEEAGALQENNYGRDPGGVGGPEGDYARCEAADGGGTNNANWNNAASRMQMFLWPGNQFGSQNQVVVDGGPSFGAGWARFGPPAMNAGVSGEFFDAGNGCVADDYAGAPAGDWIAIVVGGTTGCQPIQKARAADAAGAVAIVMSTGTSSTGIIASNAGGMNTASPEIPAVLVTTANGNALRAALPASGTVRKHPDHPGIRDGDFENGIIFHEYGHGLSIRLTGGPTVSCLGSGGNQQQAGEGWSDYVANVAMIDPDLDDPQAARGMGPYALFQDSRQGAGIRHRPYSRNMVIQPGTFDSIKTNGWLPNAAGNPTSVSSPHGIGHVFAAMLWDMTWDLIDKHGFSGNIYLPWDAGGNNRAMQYMVDGLKLQGCGPDFVTASRAIIESANILGGGAAGEVEGDACTLWASFSRRGLGFSATSPPTPSGNRNVGTEAFDTHPDCREGFAGPALEPYGELNQADPGKVLTFRFAAPEFGGQNPLMPTNSPFSRKVDCTTLQVPSQLPAPIITPREYPLDATPAGQGLKFKQNEGLYVFPWQTEEEWLGTCREFVVTRLDGTQHRAFFEFLYPFAGFSGTFSSAPVLNDTSSKNVSTFWWKLGGDRGLGILAANPQSRPIDCATFAPLGAYEPTDTTTGLGYQASTARYFYPWQPPAGNDWKGTCREFTIALVDGTSHSAYLRYVK
jgi:extracellular elastinolytic metalloproteinase